jgi:hypothetical protein
MKPSSDCHFPAIWLRGRWPKSSGTQAVIIAYATTGQTPEYRETRRATMCTWTMEVLEELEKENWAGIFRFKVLGSNGTENRLKSRAKLGVRFYVIDFWVLAQCTGSRSELARSDRCLWWGDISKVVDSGA